MANFQVPGIKRASEAEKLAPGFRNQFDRLTSAGLADDPFLGQTVQTNPEMSRIAMEVFRNQSQGQFDRSRQDLVNQLEGLGALTSSTTSNRLGNLQEDFNRQQAAVGGQATIADINRALENRIRLTGLGLQAGQTGADIDLRATAGINQARQQSFENQLAMEALESGNKKGGLAGGLTGALGGAATGFALTGNPFGALAGAGLGGAAGAFGPSGTGGSLAKSGLGFAGSQGRGVGGFGSQGLNLPKQQPFVSEAGAVAGTGLGAFGLEDLLSQGRRF